MTLIVEDRTKLSGVINGLCNRSIMWSPDVVVVKHPIKDEFVVLKSRFSNKDTLNIGIDKFETCKDRRNWDEGYEELYRKNIIIDEFLLNENAKMALSSL